jgi:catechol 2,3-dioxygenase-like lactoylglutathione lyase family enzyme
MKILELTLTAGNCEELKKFYSDELGFKEIEAPSATDGFSFQCGFTRINFVPGDKDARYHFAFNIHPDQLNDSMKWIDKHGVDLLDNENDDSKIVDFPAWRAKSVYIFDPEGNIVEFIARAAIPPAGNAPKFSATSFCGVSEIGIVCDDVPAMREWIENVHGIKSFSRQENNDQFSALGDDEGLLLLVPQGRPWFMGNFDAFRFPLFISVENQGKMVKLMLP